ncbi:hypothetical protein OJAV_G00026770 [Oryzias javanicus]|uniref:Uncharacterized protein n=1 Tax=Oryzias javanicus TaxID=123683 RepID=A0A3S2MUP4_ORYJA|nr:hypothetical protein OJAV_G00026770 [Oryzias javanicus]
MLTRENSEAPDSRVVAVEKKRNTHGKLQIGPQRGRGHSVQFKKHLGSNEDLVSTVVALRPLADLYLHASSGSAASALNSPNEPLRRQKLASPCLIQLDKR